MKHEEKAEERRQSNNHADKQTETDRQADKKNIHTSGPKTKQKVAKSFQLGF